MTTDSGKARALGNEPAGYVPDVIDHERNYYSYGGPGLTKRQEFAKAAMQGVLSNAYWNEHGEYTPEAVSIAAIEYADALLAALAAADGSAT